MQMRLPGNQTWLLVTVLLLLVPQLFSCSDNTVTPSDEPGWVQTKGPYAGNVSNIAINQQGHVFAGTMDDGLYRSMDDCSRWTDIKIEKGYDLLVIGSGINAQGDLFVFSLGTMTLGGGIYRSLDNGDSWTYVSSADMDGLIVAGFVITDTGYIFATAYPPTPEGPIGGTFRSTDNGDTWVKLTDMNGGLAVNSRGDLFMGASDRTGIYRSSDNGNTWMLIPGSPAASGVAINAEDQIFAVSTNAIFRSLDDGTSWTQLTSGLGNLFATIAFNQAGHIFAGSDGCVFRSTDNGDTWTTVGENILNSLVSSLAVDPAGQIFAGALGDGLLRSRDNGDTWETVGVPIREIRDIAAYPRDILYARTDYGLYRSESNGDSWHLLEFDCWIEAVSPDGSLYATSAIYGEHGLWRSIDNGDSWSCINDTTFHGLAINSTGEIFRPGGSAGVFRSLDHGESWQQVSSGLVDVHINAVTVDANDVVYASSLEDDPPLPPASPGVMEGIFFSKDNGDTWEALGGHGGEWLVSNGQGYLFVGAFGSLYRATISSGEWTLPLPSTPVRSLACSSNGALYAGTDNGVLYSLNNGNDWLPLNADFRTGDILALTFNAHNVLFAATRWRGVLRLE